MALELKMKPQIKQMESSGKKRTESDRDVEEEDEGLKLVGPVQPVNLLLNIF